MKYETTQPPHPKSQRPPRHGGPLGTLSRYRRQILALTELHGAESVCVFGSTIHGYATADSDLDLLVSFAPNLSLLDRIALIQDMEALLGVEVDVVTEKALHPLIRDEVLQEAIPLRIQTRRSEARVGYGAGR